MITFYATICAGDERDYMPDVPVMLPASSWARFGLPAPRLPDHVGERAADCGGFVATLRWGGYRYSPAQYVDWLYTFSPSWAATMDYCCEPEVAGRAGIGHERQEATTEMAWRFWRDYGDVPWAWVPTVQGWEVADYRRHAREMVPLIREMARRCDERFRVGIGTLCRRASVTMILRVIDAVSGELPGVPLHLWGVKLAVLRAPRLLHNVVSIDSAAWNACFGKGIEERRRSGLSEREYYYRVALPTYLRKVEEALARPKQQCLLGLEATDAHLP